jgi:hypothetical protein
MRQHYILTTCPEFATVLEFIRTQGLQYEIHLNRTRFWIDPISPLSTEFLLRWSHCCPVVDSSLDLATGLPKEKPYE